MLLAVFRTLKEIDIMTDRCCSRGKSSRFLGRQDWSERRSDSPSDRAPSNPAETFEARFPRLEQSMDTIMTLLGQVMARFNSAQGAIGQTTVVLETPAPAQVAGPSIPSLASQPPTPPVQSTPPPVVHLQRDSELGYDWELDRLIQFLDFKPPLFNGVKDPVVADDWINKMEKLFRFFRCSDTEKVAFAVFMLKGEADHWWNCTRPILRAQHLMITWEIFLNAFKRQYISDIAKRRLQMEFLNLTQGNKSVDEYESRFTSLGRFDLDTSNEMRKVRKFMDGLRPSIRSRLAPLDITIYQEAVRRAQLCEEDDELNVSEMARVGKGKVKDRKRSIEDKGYREGKKQGGKIFKATEEPRSEAIKPPAYPTVAPARGIVIGGSRPTTEQCKNNVRFHGNWPCYVVAGACFRCGRTGHLMRDCPEATMIASQKGKESEKAPATTSTPKKKATSEEKGKQIAGRGRVYALDQDTVDTSSE